MYWLGSEAKDCVDLDQDLDAEYTVAMNSASLSASGCAGAALYRVCGYRLPIVLVGAGTAWRNGLPTEWIPYREPCMKSEQERKSDCGQLGGATLKIKRGAAVRPLRSRAAGAIPSETMWYSGEPSGKSVLLSLQLDMQLEKVKVAISHDLKRMIRRNKLLGMWAAEKLGFTGEDADAYSDALAVGTLDHERSDVFSRIRKDFDAAGVVESDEQILRVMDEFMLKAGNQMEVTRGDSSDSAVVSLARNLMR
jgi:hypothetical protein